MAAWVFTIAGHCVADHYRTRSRRPVTTADDASRRIDTRQPGPDEAILKIEQHKIVYDLIDSLPEPQAQVVRLKALAGLSFSQIADMLDTPPATVRSRMRYGLIGMHKTAIDRGEPTP